MRKISLLIFAFCLLFSLAINSQVKTQAKKPAKRTSKKIYKSSNAYFMDVNPHALMFEGGKINHDICLLCHKFRFDSESGLIAKKESLNAEVNDLCEDCHGLNPHPGAKLHLVKPDRDKMIRIKQWQKQNKKELWLDKKGKITCSTCHNMHPEGLFKAISEEFAKNYKSYMNRYHQIQTHKSSMFKESKKRIKRSGFKVRKRGKPLLPFREDMTGGNFCKICHDLK